MRKHLLFVLLTGLLFVACAQPSQGLSGDPFCDDYAQKLVSGCPRGFPSATFAANACKTNLARSPCPTQYRAALSCQESNFACTDAGVEFFGCTDEELAYSNCVNAHQEGGAPMQGHCAYVIGGDNIGACVATMGDPRIDAANCVGAVSGTYGSGPCPSANRLGACTSSGGTPTVYYASAACPDAGADAGTILCTAADAKAYCENFGGAFQP